MPMSSPYEAVLHNVYQTAYCQTRDSKLPGLNWNEIRRVNLRKILSIAEIYPFCLRIILEKRTHCAGSQIDTALVLHDGRSIYSIWQVSFVII